MRALLFAFACLVSLPAFADHKSSDVTLEVTLTDNLGIRRGPNGAWTPMGAPHVSTWFIRVPPKFLRSNKLTPAAEDFFYASLYGPTWKQGNDDGSRYLPVEAKVRVLTAKEIATALWTQQNRKLVVFALDGTVREKLGEVQTKPPAHLDAVK